MGILQKTAKFLGINKFGEGLATASRIVSGSVAEDMANQMRGDASIQKLLYAARQEQNPVRKQNLLKLIANLSSNNISAEQIDPGLKLSNRQIIGSAANVALNILTPQSFQGNKAAILGKNVILGGAFGMASGLEKNRSASGVVGSTAGGAIIGGGIGATSILAKVAKNFIGNTVPEWMMNKAVKPALQDLKKNVKFGSATLGKELLDEGVKGGPQKLLEIADNRMQHIENELQSILENTDKVVRRKKILLYLKDMITHKRNVPGTGSDINTIEAIVNDLPAKMTVSQANEIKRAIYQELRDPAYKLDAKLSTKAQTLKIIAKGLKTEIENIVGGTVIKDLNHKLSIYGRLENAIVDQLAREMRNNGIGLTDAILAAGGPTTSVLALLRHLGLGTKTYTANLLYKLNKAGTGIMAKTIKNLSKRAIFNLP